MNTYKRHRFPPDIISYAVWLYYRFNLRRNDLWEFTLPNPICSIWVAIWSAPNITGISGQVRSQNGVGRLFENPGQITAV